MLEFVWFREPNLQFYRYIKVDEKKACTVLHKEVTEADLPLCCPMSEQRLWDAHPRVYLPIEKTGRAVCPYCDTVFTLNNVQ